MPKPLAPIETIIPGTEGININNLKPMSIKYVTTNCNPISATFLSINKAVSIFDIILFDIISLGLTMNSNADNCHD